MTSIDLVRWLRTGCDLEDFDEERKNEADQGWAVVPGPCRDPGPVPQIPMIGTGTGTQSHGTVGTGTKICGTVPLLKSRGTPNPGISGQESRSVSGRSRCPGILRDANPALSRCPWIQFDAFTFSKQLENNV